MEREELEQEIRRYSPMVYRLAYIRTGNHHDAEDVTQDVFLRLLEKVPVFESEEHKKAWLLRVTANRANDLARSSWRRWLPLSQAESLPAPEKEEGGEVARLMTLPPKLRVAVHLFYYEELTVKEIAQALHISEGGAKARLSRARALLRRDALEGGEPNG